MRKNCIICEKEIFRSKNTSSNKLRRGKNAVTCSRDCARIYRKVSNYISNLRRLKNQKIFESR